MPRLPRPPKPPKPLTRATSTRAASTRAQAPTAPKPPRSRLKLQQPNEQKPPKAPPSDKIQQWGYVQGPDPISGWDVPSVASTLAEHRRGMFQYSGVLAEDMASSPLIRHCLEQLAQTFTTAPCLVVPSSRGEGRRCADFIREVLPDILPLPTLRDLHRNWVMMGTSLAALDWKEYRDGRDRVWLPTVKPWQPQLSYYQQFADSDSVDMGALVATTLNRGLVRVDPGNSRWLLLNSSKLKPWLNGAVNTLGEVFLGWSFNFRDNMAFQDRFGRGIMKLHHPMSWKDEEIQVAVSTLLRGSGGGVLPLPTNPKGEKIADLNLLQADGTGFKTFESTYNRLRDLILITMLGQNMTSVGSTGGFAQARVHQMGLWRKFEQQAAAFNDAVLTTTIEQAEGTTAHVQRQWQPRDGALRTQLTKWIALWNFGDMDLAPYVYWDVTEPEDVKEQLDTHAKEIETTARAMQAFSTAVEKLSSAGIPFDAQTLAKQCGIDLGSVNDRFGWTSEDQIEIE